MRLLSTLAQLTTFNNNTIFQSPANYTIPGTLYARTVELSDGTLLATWENYSPEPPPVYFPIFKSTDYGQSWAEISRVQDTARGFGLRYQPFLYELPASFAGFKQGDILLSGSSIPTNLSSTHIELYASRDGGYTWSFVSHIADGGVAEPTNGLTPVWEPFLLLLNGELICFYSDQRDPAHGQKLVHQTTTDGESWGPVVDDVAYANYTARPGMTTVASLPGGQWFMTYENGGGMIGGVYPNSYQFPVYYKISSSPLTFGNVTGLPLVATDGTVPSSSPYNTATRNGLIIVSANSHSEAFINQATSEGKVDGSKWVKVETGERRSYTRSLRLLQHEEDRYLLLADGGSLPPSKQNRVQVGLIDISGQMVIWGLVV
ncbi:glycoside hydrolase family 93 protein [Baudoinia panamericana UAMH 10762]|uniref:Glycoside hydrolase family 93 protein n=1 Tax=Baudoinia panamericana (strain UAMH 10762) TaxID=717646 RepID=M2MRK5_BAUPA|nr:glycoside hydrolase family 93 protein [Baudoinia panamericana UAMH 10762]EMC94103.1 glycoside hydrolase family 93 protein [Baudoinia panamericana UAMH 10762]